MVLVIRPFPGQEFYTGLDTKGFNVRLSVQRQMRYRKIESPNHEWLLSILCTVKSRAEQGRDTLRRIRPLLIPVSSAAMGLGLVLSLWGTWLDYHMFPLLRVVCEVSLIALALLGFQLSRYLLPQASEMEQAYTKMIEEVNNYLEFLEKNPLARVSFTEESV